MAEQVKRKTRRKVKEKKSCPGPWPWPRAELYQRTEDEQSLASALLASLQTRGWNKDWKILVCQTSGTLTQIQIKDPSALPGKGINLNRKSDFEHLQGTPQRKENNDTHLTGALEKEVLIYLGSQNSKRKLIIPYPLFTL